MNYPPLPSRTSASRPRLRGFSLVEVVVVAGLAAAIFSTAALAYRTVIMHQKRATTYLDIQLGAGITKAFLDNSTGTLSVYTAPNYGMSAQAENMRQRFTDDLAHATAVYCLPRQAITVDVNTTSTDKVPGVNYIHPNNIDITPASGATPLAGTSLDHPNAFRALLAAKYPSSFGPFPFQDYRGVPAADAVNGSIYIMQMTSQRPPLDPNFVAENNLTVRAIYDLDFLPVADPAGSTYASVKRWDGNLRTDYYDILYVGPSVNNDQATTAFGPIFACFERSVRKAYTEASGIATQANAFKRATDRPFYFIWWPDPAIPRLLGPPLTNSYTTADPRYYYQKHEEQTSWMFTVPMFPPL